MPTIVQFGAGAIGRGFLGHLWTEGGYEVVYVEANPELAAALNARGAYPLRLIEGDQAETRIIGPVRAILATDEAAVTEALAECAFACTAVGVNVIERLARTLALGILERLQRGAEPINIICCENQVRAGEKLRGYVAAALSPDEAEALRFLTASVGFVDASVGRMVPPATPELLAEDALLIQAETYAELPIDADAWRGTLPAIPALAPRRNFAGYVARKLYTHNGGHALLAYEGYRRGHEFIYQAAEDAELVAELEGYWQETGTALIRAYGFAQDEQRAHQSDLLRRFRNRALGDTTIRVARDPVRKLRRDDRLVGAALLCEGQGIAPRFVARAIAAALRFDFPGDPTAPQLQELVARDGVRGTLFALASVPTDSPLAAWVEQAYNGAEKL